MHFSKTAIALFALLLISKSSAYTQPREDLYVSGYGALHFNDEVRNNNATQSSGVLDFHHFVLLTNYDFNEWISFESEIELRHTLLKKNEDSGELALNQAYINMHLIPALGIRAGLIPVPSGITNLSHRPTDFHGVERPNVETFLIPTTWSESGIGVFGSTDFGISYQAYVMAGLIPNKITGERGIRDARQRGFESSTANIAFSTRLDYQLFENLSLGTSYYISTLSSRIENNSAETVPSLKSAIFNMAEGHVQFSRKRFKAKGLFVFSRILDVEDLNEEYGNSAGQIQSGAYIELAYNILPFFLSPSKQELYVFMRGESYDTNFSTGEIPRNNEFLREELVLGMTYKPDPKVVFKMDYQFLTSLGSKYVEQINLGVAYNF